jgi:DNA polymerase-3 subunit delta'
VRQRRGLTEKDARFLAIVSGGRLGLALEADPEAFRAERAEFLRLVSPETVENISGLLSACEAVGKSDRAEASLGWLAAWFRDLVIVKVGGDRTRLLNADCLEELEALAVRLKVETIADLAAYVESMHRGLERNLNKQLMLEGLLLRLRAALQAKAA